jgi:hypothetical protein
MSGVLMMIDLDKLRYCKSAMCRTRPDGSANHAIDCIHWHPEVEELIDAVEKLQAIILDDHRASIFQPVTDLRVWFASCLCDELHGPPHPTKALAEQAHAAHVAEVLP